MTSEIHLRDVAGDDLPIFFADQSDPDAHLMAAVPPRDREAYMAHWANILHDVAIAKQTILCDGQVAGYLVCFERDGKREVGYWISKPFWGKGIASSALSAFLDHISTRPLYGVVAKHNPASRRVLEKCGFTLIGEEDNAYLLRLDAR